MRRHFSNGSRCWATSNALYLSRVPEVIVYSPSGQTGNGREVHHDCSSSATRHLSSPAAADTAHNIASAAWTRKFKFSIFNYRHANEIIIGNPAYVMAKFDPRLWSHATAHSTRPALGFAPTGIECCKSTSVALSCLRRLQEPSAARYVSGARRAVDPSYTPVCLEVSREQLWVWSTARRAACESPSTCLAYRLWFLLSWGESLRLLQAFL